MKLNLSAVRVLIHFPFPLFVRRSHLVEMSKFIFEECNKSGGLPVSGETIINNTRTCTSKGMKIPFFTFFLSFQIQETPVTHWCVVLEIMVLLIIIDYYNTFMRDNCQLHMVQAVQ